MSKSSRSLSHCKICGAHAIYCYYGAIACQSCKTFFRRNARNGKKNCLCLFDGQCGVNINNRHVCSVCRLKKCLEVGMSADLLRGPRMEKKTTIKDEDKTSSSQIVKRTREHPEQLLVLNLLRSDNSILTSDDWNLLTNLVHNYNEGNMNVICQRWIFESRDLCTNNDLNKILTKEFFRLLYQTSEMCLRSNHDICTLRFDDRSILLRTGADCVTCFGGPFLMHHYQLTTCPAFTTMLRNTYGEQSLALTVNSLKYVDVDRILLKLAPLLLVFSQNISVYSPRTSFNHYTDSRKIFHIQNTYVEVIWKYLLYKHDSREIIRKLLGLIRFLFSIIETMTHLQSIQSHVDDIHSIVESTELQLILDDIERIEH